MFSSVGRILVAGVLLAGCSVIESQVVVCQYASWAVYRPSAGQFGPNMVDPDLCTHGVYITAGLDDNDKLVSLDPWADLTTGGGMGGYKKFTSLKQQNENFKPILGLGSWAYANYQYAAIAADPARRKALAQNAVSFLKLHGFEGLEVDWLYPVTANEKNNFPLLLAELKSAFAAEGFEVLATVAALESTIEQAYELEAMAGGLDYFVMLGYDYEGAWNPWTGLTTPLYHESQQSSLSVDSTVSAYLSRGVNPAQLVLGFPGFGRTYSLANPSENGIGAAALGPGDSAPYTRTPGVMSYHEFSLVQSQWTIERDSLSQSPYAYLGNQWISYDDQVSATFKAEYCVSKGLAGAAIWTVDQDNFKDQEFTLVRAISTALAKLKR